MKADFFLVTLMVFGRRLSVSYLEHRNGQFPRGRQKKRRAVKYLKTVVRNVTWGKGIMFWELFSLFTQKPCGMELSLLDSCKNTFLYANRFKFLRWLVFQKVGLSVCILYSTSKNMQAKESRCLKLKLVLKENFYLEDVILIWISGKCMFYGRFDWKLLRNSSRGLFLIIVNECIL